MLKHHTIAAGIAALMLGLSLGYLFAATNLNSSRSNIYKATGGKTMPFSYTLNLTIDHGTAPLTAADKKAILSQVCAQATQELAR